MQHRKVIFKTKPDTTYCKCTGTTGILLLPGTDTGLLHRIASETKHAYMGVPSFLTFQTPLPQASTDLRKAFDSSNHSGIMLISATQGHHHPGPE